MFLTSCYHPVLTSAALSLSKPPRTMSGESTSRHEQPSPAPFSGSSQQAQHSFTLTSSLRSAWRSFSHAAFGAPKSTTHRERHLEAAAPPLKRSRDADEALPKRRKLEQGESHSRTSAARRILTRCRAGEALPLPAEAGPSQAVSTEGTVRSLSGRRRVRVSYGSPPYTETSRTSMLDSFVVASAGEEIRRRWREAKDEENRRHDKRRIEALEDEVLQLKTQVNMQARRPSVCAWLMARRSLRSGQSSSVTRKQSGRPWCPQPHRHRLLLPRRLLRRRRHRRSALFALPSRRLRPSLLSLLVQLRAPPRLHHQHTLRRRRNVSKSTALCVRRSKSVRTSSSPMLAHLSR